VGEKEAGGEPWRGGGESAGGPGRNEPLPGTATASGGMRRSPLKLNCLLPIRLPAEYGEAFRMDVEARGPPERPPLSSGAPEAAKPQISGARGRVREGERLAGTPCCGEGERRLGRKRREGGQGRPRRGGRGGRPEISRSPEPHGVCKRCDRRGFLAQLLLVGADCRSCDRWVFLARLMPVGGGGWGF